MYTNPYNETLKQNQEDKDRVKNAGITVATTALGTLIGTLVAPGAGTAAGATAGAASGASAAEGALSAKAATDAATAATATAEGTKGILGAKTLGNVGSKIAGVGEDLAKKGVEKGNEKLVNFGTKVANGGGNIANLGGNIANWEKNKLGNTGAQLANNVATKGLEKGESYIKNQIENNQYQAPNVQASNGQFQNTVSDENDKISQSAEQADIDPVDYFSKIDAYLYKYKPEAQAQYSGTNNQENFGVMAQELEQNPLTESAVIQGNDGHLSIDGSRLSTINTAVIGELCKRIMNLEAMVYGGQQ